MRRFQTEPFIVQSKVRRASNLPSLRLLDTIAFVLLCAYFVFWPFWYSEEGKETVRLLNFRLDHILLALVCAAGGSSLLLRWRGFPSNRFVVALIGYAAVTLLWSIEPKLGLWIALHFFAMLVFAKILSNNRKRQAAAQWSFLAGVGLMLLNTPPAEIQFGALGWFTRITNYNQVAAMCAFSVVILVSMGWAALQEKKQSLFRVLFLSGAAVVLVAVMLLTGSRTGLLSALGGLSTLLFLRCDAGGKLRIRKPRLLVIPGLAAVAILLLPSFVSTERRSLVQRYEEGYFQGDLSGRDSLWKSAGELFLSSPQTAIFGTGAGGFEQGVVDYLETPQYRIAVQMGSANSARPFPQFAAHNDFVRIACELGVIGLILFGIFLFKVWRHSVEIGSQERSVFRLSLFITLLIMGMGGDLLHFALFPTILAIVLAPVGDKQVNLKISSLRSPPKHFVRGQLQLSPRPKRLAGEKS